MDLNPPSPRANDHARFSDKTADSQTTVVVGFHSTSDSIEALRWAIDLAKETNSPLKVVHATDVAITVRNGPSSAVANTLGNPTWASVYSIVAAHNPPAETTTIVEQGSAVDVLAKHAKDASAVVLGPRRFRILPINTEKRLKHHLAVPVVRVVESTIVLDGLGRTVGEPRAIDVQAAGAKRNKTKAMT